MPGAEVRKRSVRINMLVSSATYAERLTTTLTTLFLSVRYGPLLLDLICNNTAITKKLVRVNGPIGAREQMRRIKRD